MNNYFFATISVIILLAFLDIIISKTKNGKVVKSVVSLIAVTMLAVPIVSIVKGDNSLIKEGYYSEYTKNYLIDLEKKVVKNKIKEALKDLEYEILNVEVEYFSENDLLEIKKVTVYLSSAVINENNEHIDILESVKNAMSTVVDVQKVEIEVEADWR